MFDQFLRPAKDRLLSPLVRQLGDGVHPIFITGLAAVFGAVVVVSTWRGAWYLAALFWCLNRIVDGLDGAVARASGRQSDLGGYLDMMIDVVIYSAIPVTFAVRQSDDAVFVVVMVLLAAYYINITSWLYLSALREKRQNPAEPDGIEIGRTSISMHRGLVEGTETIVLYLVFFLFPGFAIPLFAIMAAGTLAGSIQRIVWAIRTVD